MGRLDGESHRRIRMLRALRAHLSYAAVLSTLALVFSMSGGALAAKHYLIDSTSQFSPAVMRALHKDPRGGRKGSRGATGRVGPAGATGARGGVGYEGFRGAQGSRGRLGPEGLIAQEGAVIEKAEPFSASRNPGELQEQNAFLFSFPEEIEGRLVCGAFAGHSAGGIKVYAPPGSRGQARVTAYNTEGKPPRETKELAKAIPLAPSYGSESEGFISELAFETGKMNLGHIRGTITTQTGVVVVDAFMEVAPNSTGHACTITGAAFMIPR